MARFPSQPVILRPVVCPRTRWCNSLGSPRLITLPEWQTPSPIATRQTNRPGHRQCAPTLTAPTLTAPTLTAPTLTARPHPPRHAALRPPLSNQCKTYVYAIAQTNFLGTTTQKYWRPAEAHPLLNSYFPAPSPSMPASAAARAVAYGTCRASRMLHVAPAYTHRYRACMGVRKLSLRCRGKAPPGEHQGPPATHVPRTPLKTIGI